MSSALPDSKSSPSTRISDDHSVMCQYATDGHGSLPVRPEEVKPQTPRLVPVRRRVMVQKTVECMPAPEIQRAVVAAKRGVPRGMREYRKRALIGSEDRRLKRVLIPALVPFLLVGGLYCVARASFCSSAHTPPRLYGMRRTRGPPNSPMWVCTLRGVHRRHWRTRPQQGWLLTRWWDACPGQWPVAPGIPRAGEDLPRHAGGGSEAHWVGGV